MSIRIWACSLAVAAMCGTCSASVVTTTMTGRVAIVSPPLQGLGVAPGDALSLAFTFDDSTGVPSIASVNGGVLYQLLTFSFVVDMAGWIGTLPALITSRTPAVTSNATKQSWSRPATVLHHNEWTAGEFGLSIITDYAGNPGGQAYGWYQYGNAATVEFLLDSVTTQAAAPPAAVSEPGALVCLAMAGLAGLVGTLRTRPGLLARFRP